MYRVIGADGQQYGAVGGEVLRRWIAENRVNGQTLAQAEGTPGWKPLSAFPEFADLSAPPPLRSAPAVLPAEGAHPLKNSPLAVAGLVCSLLGLFCCGGGLLSTLGLIFSIIGLGEINRNPNRFTGRSLAVAGIVLGILGVLLVIGFFVTGFGGGILRGLRHHHRFVL